MKRTITLFLLLLAARTYAQHVELKSGDLIFQESCLTATDNPIKQVTRSIDNYQFTHVGMVYVDAEGDVFVLEATTPKVVLTPLAEYLYPSDGDGCWPLSVVGRLKAEFQPLIPQALTIGMTHIGKAYDYGYVLGNDCYYCSELVYEILRESNDGMEVFLLNTMTFKVPGTNDTAVGWVEYFRKYGLPIPEGEDGINPGAMSRSDVLEWLIPY